MRIISGAYGGRPLKAVTGQDTRPTSDRLKETIFNIIGPYFKGGNVLDLYAGSGALGIEAVSRGMDSAVLVDASPAAIRVISENIAITKEAFKFEALKSKAHYALATLASRNEKFKLVFLDPPYAEEIIEEDIQLLVEKDLLDEVALIVCEVGKTTDLPDEIAGLQVWDRRKYRNKKIVMYQKLAETNEPVEGDIQ